MEENMRKLSHAFAFLLIAAMILTACGPQVVEVEVVVTPTPIPIGRELIREGLSGPVVVLDSAQWPASYDEAPMLKEMVEAGKLPPVEERLPQEPLVLKPLNEIGQYGGIVRRGFTGPGDAWNPKRYGAHDHILFWKFDMSEVIPNIAKGWEKNEDGTEWTIFLREGMRWSDGAPFTSADFVFWFDDIYSNNEIIAVPGVDLPVGTQVVAVDETTVKYILPRTNYLFHQALAGFSPIASQANWGYTGMGGYAPAHYLTQYLPSYTSQEQVDAQADEAGFDNWVNLLKSKMSWQGNPDLPAVTPWTTSIAINNPSWVLERNAYYWEVDTAGNQLPYHDYIVLEVAESVDVINLRAVAGEYDFQARHIDVVNLPLFLENQERGGYDVFLDPTERGTQAGLIFNMSYDGDPEIVKWINSLEFRRAISLGIDREQINEAFFLGLAEGGNVLPVETNPFSPGADENGVLYRMYWHTYDPDTANQMLDDLGLTEKDADGNRLRPDNGEPLILEVLAPSEAFLPFPQISEMINDQWKAIGIQLDIRAVERSQGETMTAANQHQIWMWEVGDNIVSLASTAFPNGAGGYASGPLYGEWFDSRGASGLEPPPEMRRVMEMWYELGGFETPEELTAQVQEMWKIIADQTWTIGTVGAGPVIFGTRIVNRRMGNVAPRQIVNTAGMTPGLIRSEQFYYKDE
jgi:peptide/nickel transport system substrate-binding protein